jgi:hypothetical protein
MSESEFSPLYNKIKKDIKKASYDLKSFKYNIYNEIYTSDIMSGLRGFEKHIYHKINAIDKNTIWYTIYLVIRFLLITFINFMVVFLPLLLAISIVGYFRYSPSWLGKTVRHLLRLMIETPYESRPPG